MYVGCGRPTQPGTISCVYMWLPVHVKVKNDSEERQDETVSEGTYKQDRVAPFPIVLMSLSEDEEGARSSGRLRQVSTNGNFQGQYEMQRVNVP